MTYVYEKESPRRKAQYKQLKDSTFALLGEFCKKCGFSDKRVLQIDHVNGGGSKERLRLTGREFYRSILRNPDESVLKYQILCANCNWIKRHEQFENRGRIKK